MIGPCLCGDPIMSEFGEVIDRLTDKINELGMDEIELAIFESVGFAAVQAHRAACAAIKDRQTTIDVRYEEWCSGGDA